MSNVIRAFAIFTVIILMGAALQPAIASPVKTLQDTNLTPEPSFLTGATVSALASLVQMRDTANQHRRGVGIDVEALINATPGPEINFSIKWGSAGIAPGQFIEPWDAAFDSKGNIYVLDTGNNRIQKFYPNGTFTAQWGSAGNAPGQFNLPRSITLCPSADNDTDLVFVADTGNHRIQKFYSNGTFVAQWGTKGAGNGQFKNLTGIAADIAGNVFVADTENYRIQKFNSSGGFITKWGSQGMGSGTFNLPSGIAIDNLGGAVFVADTANHRIQKFNSSGGFIAKWGSEGAAEAQFELPQGVAIDSSGNVFVADTENHRVQKFGYNGTFILKWGTEGTGNGTFKSPAGITVDADGKVYVADTDNNRVQKFLQRDNDADGLPNSVELVLGTDPNDRDTDRDMLNDSYEVRNKSIGTDPLKPDSNGDGLADYFEVTDVSLNVDGDDFPNAWDCDNDGDGVVDGLDSSPFTKSTTHDKFHFDIKTKGKPLYLDFQVRPKNPEHMKLPFQSWDWPDDDKGQIQDLDKSKDDVQIQPMLELEISKGSFIAQSEVKDYGIVIVEADPFTDKIVYGNWSSIKSGHELIYLGGDRVLDWVPETGEYRIWRYDRSKTGKADPFTDKIVYGNWSSIKSGHELIYLGGDRVLDWVPETGEYRIWRYDRSKTGKADPFTDKIVYGNWSSIKSGHELIYLGGDRVLDWVPETGEYRIWRYDRSKTGKADPFTDKIVYGNWSSIKSGHELIYLGGDRVLDWVPETGEYRIWRYSVTAYVPLTPAQDYGTTVAFNGRMFFPASDAPLNLSADARLVWMVNAKTDNYTLHHTWHPIINKHSGMCMDVEGKSKKNGANIHQWEWEDQDNQKWKLEPVVGGYYNIINKHSGKCAEVEGENIRQWECESWWNDNQKWSFEPVGEYGYYKIINKYSGLCAEVEDSSKSNGANIIQQREYRGHDNQKWRFVPNLVMTETTTIAHYKEDFMLTGFSVTENYGSDAGLFYSSTDKNQTMNAYIVLRYEFLRSQNTLSEAPAKLLEHNVSVTHEIKSFSHQDAAVIAVLNMTRDALDSLPDGKVLPIVFALSDVSADSVMGEFVSGSSYIQGDDYDVDLTNKSEVTGKSIKMSWYNTTTDELITFDELLEEVKTWEGDDVDKKADMLILLLIASFGETTLPKVGTHEIEFEDPEKNEVLQKVYKGKGYIGFGRGAGLFFVFICSKLLMTRSFLRVKNTILVRLSGEIEEAPNLSQQLDQLIDELNAVKATKTLNELKGVVGEQVIAETEEAGWLSKLGKFSKALKILGWVVVVAVAIYTFIVIAKAEGWSAFGFALGAAYAIMQIAYFAILFLIACIPFVGWAIALAIVITDLILTYFFHYGSSWVMKKFINLFIKFKLRVNIDLEQGETKMNIKDYDDNGLTAGDKLEIESWFWAKASETSRGKHHGDHGDYKDSYIKPKYAYHKDDSTFHSGSYDHYCDLGGWTKIDQDLNAGAGGDYIYLYVKPPVLNNLKVISGDHSCGSGWTKLDQDLNAGAGGDYIYLCVKGPVKNNLKVISGDHSCGSGWTKIDHDLNAGAGGDYIYLCVKEPVHNNLKVFSSFSEKKCYTGLWIKPKKGMINLPLTTWLSSDYKFYYDECCCGICSGNHKTGTTETKHDTSYFDVLPKNINDFVRWHAITLRDNDGDGLLNEEEKGKGKNYYKICAEHSGKCLDVSGSSTVTGANVEQWVYEGKDSQKWKLEPVDDGYHKICAKHSGKCLSIEDGGTYDGANVVQKTYGGYTDQKWNLEHVGEGNYKIINNRSSKCLNVSHNSTANGANVWQWDWWNKEDQKWKLVPVECDTNANKWDTDADGLSDMFEVYSAVDSGTNPRIADTDGDGLTDMLELELGTRPDEKDTDGDGLTDFEEHRGWRIKLDYMGDSGKVFSESVWSNPLTNDSDMDGLNDSEEFRIGFNPRSSDTNGDGISDADAMPYIPTVTKHISNVSLNDEGNCITVSPGESVAVSLDYRIWNPKVESSRERWEDNWIDMGLDSTALKCIYHDVPAESPDVTTGSASFSFNAPDAEGIYCLNYDVTKKHCNDISPSLFPHIPDWICHNVKTVNKANIGAIKVTTETEGSSSAGEVPGGEEKWSALAQEDEKDTDGDGLSDLREMGGWVINFTNSTGTHTIHVTSDPWHTDTDFDGLNDSEEYNLGSNPRHVDTDGDGLNDFVERELGTDITHYDTDVDGLDDCIAITFGSHPKQNDTDGDGLADFEEFELGSDPNNPDTDSDGLNDYLEKQFNSSLRNPDSDADLLFDNEEYNLSTDPWNPDTDSDNLTDGYESIYNTSALNNDTDADGILDGDEIDLWTDPVCNDTDSDGLNDSKELKLGTSPINPDTNGDGLNDSEDPDTHVPQVEQVVLAYDQDADKDTYEFVDKLEQYTNVTVVSAEELLLNYSDAQYIVLVGKPDGNGTAGNITRDILNNSGDVTTLTEMLESDYDRLAVSYGVWTPTQTVVMLSQPYKYDYCRVLSILKGMRVTRLPDSVKVEYPSARDFFSAEIVKEVDSSVWVELEEAVTPWVKMSRYNASTTPFTLTHAMGLASDEEAVGRYIEINVSESVQNETGDIINWAWVGMYYTASDLDRTGDGDADDVGDINESTLRLYYFNESAGKWTKLSADMDWVFDTGVDTTDNELYGKNYEGFVWANVSHLCLFGLGGKTKPPVVSSLMITPNSGTTGQVSAYNVTVNTTGFTSLNITIPAGFRAAKTPSGGELIARAELWWNESEPHYGYVTFTANTSNKMDVYADIGGGQATLTEDVNYSAGATTSIKSPFGSQEERANLTLPTSSAKGYLNISGLPDTITNVTVSIGDFVQNPDSAGFYTFTAKAEGEAVGKSATVTIEAPSPCYIATATYGTSLDENINVLRDFRDKVLVTNPVGEAFVSTYYATSPPIADALREHDGLRAATRVTLITPLVYFSKFMLNGFWFVLLMLLGLAAAVLLLREDKKKFLKSLLVGAGAIFVFITAIFSLGFVGYTIPFCAVIGAYLLPFVLPLSVVFTLCTHYKNCWFHKQTMRFHKIDTRLKIRE